MNKVGIKDRFKILMSGEVPSSIQQHIKDFLSGNDETTNEDYVNADRAMKYSAVSACVRVRAETFASVPAIVYQKTDSGRKAITDHQLYDILHYEPNEEMSPFSFKETLMTNFDVGGNIVCQKLYNKKEQLIGLYPYNYGMVGIERNKDTAKLEYKIKNDAKELILPRKDVLHVPNMSFDGVIGMSPISYAAKTINLGLSYETYGVNFYRNAAMPSGAFKHPGQLSDIAHDRLKNDLKENYTGLKKVGTPMLLEEGMDWTQITVNPIDAQLLENKYYQIEDICRIYRVPQHLINKLDRSTFNNIEHLSLEFVMYTMLPIFKRYEDCINMQLLEKSDRKKGIYVEFKIDGLLRGDAKSRAEAYAIGRQWGWLSVNDIRKLENMEPVPNGDIYLQPLNYIEAGKEQQQVTNYSKLVEDIYNMITERKCA